MKTLSAHPRERLDVARAQRHEAASTVSRPSRLRLREDLDAACAELQEVSGGVARLSLLLLRTELVEADPRAATVLLSWSDDGPWLGVDAVLCASGHRLAIDDDLGLAWTVGPLAASLDDSNISVWLPLVTVRGRLFELPLDRITEEVAWQGGSHYQPASSAAGRS